MSEILDWAGKYAVVQAAIAAVVFLWGWQKIIRRGEKDPSSEEELRAQFRRDQESHDISENLKTLVTLQRETKELLNRWIAIQSNDRQP